ncbi:serine serine/threonine-protein kinase 33-like [Octopus vulgaris]|uniref:Serine serine/threonine-protein kinase 33-like n=1 Tax=Octopus vulgaris TaxID=6645 RepID=A0AA36FH73_OCTVU|nr:serine serine/threonine-protein kinase 33-like [Octopus vulgaris]
MRHETRDPTLMCQHDPGRNAEKALAMSIASNSQTEKLDDVPHLRLDSESSLENAYQIGEKIGQGSFGKVYKVTDKKTGERWAMKCISKQKSGSAPTQLFEREVAILKRVRHENIIMLKEVFETHDKVFLIMEYCSGGELGKQLSAAVKFDEAIVKNVMTSLVSAISYLHKCGVVHRDLKLSNILLTIEPKIEDKAYFIKVTDFGLSVVKEGVRPENMLNSFCGTLNYMAPEIAENKNYSQQCDVWALGIITYQLLCGYTPFYANDEKELIKKIKIGKIVFNSPEWDNVSSEAKDFVKKLLHVDPSHRLTAFEASHHPWLTGIKDDTRQSSNVLELMTYWQEDLKKDHLKKNFNSDSSVGSKDSAGWEENETEDVKSNGSKDGQITSTVLKTSLTNSPPEYRLRRISTQPKLSAFVQDSESFGSSSSGRKMSKKKD